MVPFPATAIEINQNRIVFSWGKRILSACPRRHRQWYFAKKHVPPWLHSRDAFLKRREDEGIALPEAAVGS